MEMSSRIEEFLKACSACKRCKRVCPFLDTYGTPEEIITKNPEKVFLCSNCKACDTVCKEKLSPSDILFEMKSILLSNGSVPEEVRNAKQSASGFAMRGHKFPFSYYPATDTAFWPGCGLAGTSPEIVKKTIRLLSKTLNEKVGLVLDCCFDPLYQLGDVDSAEKATKKIQERLNRHKVMHVITGCTNCTKVLSHYLQKTKVEHILEVLPENLLNPTHTFSKDPSFTNNPFIPPLAKGGGGGFFLHHPCPSFRLDGIRERAKAHVQSLGNRSQFIKDNENTDSPVNEIKESLRPSCCGHGGGISSLSPDLSDKFTEKVMKASNGSPLVTYCMGCKGKFIEKGQKAYHLLELMTDVKPIEKPVSSGRKWVNRFFLSIGQKFNTKKLFFGLTVILLILLATYLRRSGYISTDSILEFLREHKVAAPLFFILIFAIGPSLFIPSLPLTLGSGFLWGPFWGVIFSITGATAGASVAFLVARYLMGDTIKKRFGYDKWQWLQEKVEKHGWKAVAFARLLPILPFPALNYMFGVTPIPFLHYLWSTFVFMLPACIAYVAFGSSMGALILKGNVNGLIIGIIVASVALLLPFAFKPLIKKVSAQKDI
jgi:uncharacterized membrane protein YdjX (TVP38/TMEM64 family)/Fe-S oxidoreductase